MRKVCAFLPVIILFLLTFATSSCTNVAASKTARCNELKRKIVLKTPRHSTSAINATVSQSTMVEHNYDTECSNEIS